MPSSTDSGSFRIERLICIVIRHYYHAYADGNWREPVVEHLSALRSIDEPMAVTVGLVGSADNRSQVKEEFARYDLAVDRWVEADTGWEQVTLDVLREDVLVGHNSPVLYAHTKSAHDSSYINRAWRMSMSMHVVYGWKHCMTNLDSVDAVGCHWLTPEKWPTLVTSPFFGGNFWWAIPEYLRTLPSLATNSRWDAESWIGLSDPKVLDLLPGWPALHLFSQGAINAH